jgi:hypothetical protein
MNTTPEKIPQTPEAETNPNIELEQAGHERREALREQHEQSKESPEHDVDTLHEKALEHAASAAPEKKETRNDSPAERRNHGPISRKERDASFNATMKEVRTHMPASSRVFSSVVHNKTVEKISESTGATIARPNAILSGAIAAFVVTLAVYLIAKNYGYPLSGFESIGAFVVGWLLGLVYDFLKVMITGRT